MWNCECDCEAHTIIQVRAADLKSGKTTSCGCVRSIGEEKIAILLQQAGLSFEKEKTFPTCRFESGGLARFDFYVDNKYLIEFDGIEHYEKTGGRFDSKYLAEIQYRDNIKNQWCKENNIPLIRIPYTKLNNLTIEDLKLPSPAQPTV